VTIAGNDTVGSLLRAGTQRLAGVSESPRLDTELLLGHVLGLERSAVIAYLDVPVGAGHAAAFAEALARREQGEPIAYIRGFREFHGLAIATDPRALIPRPETELLVDAALVEITARLTAVPRPPDSPPIRVADVGTGSGAIALAILAGLRRRRMAEDVLMIAIDASPDALQLARENAVGHGLADHLLFLEADLLPPAVSPPYSVICANLPYIPTGELDALPRDLSFEPRAALDGGPDGLSVIRALVDRLPDALGPEGVALLEIGADQGESAVQAVLARLPDWRCAVAPDLAGRPRLIRVERALPLDDPPS
jgi:release factor glutamine methyltransferase